MKKIFQYGTIKGILQVLKTASNLHSKMYVKYYNEIRRKVNEKNKCKIKLIH